MPTPSFNLPIGQSVTLKASVLDQNGNQLVYSPATLGYMGAPSAVQWMSSNTAVATVTTGPGMNFGTVLGVSAGSVTITASYTDNLGNTATQEINVTVYQQAATSIQVIYPDQ